jgi:hypothetical protein
MPKGKQIIIFSLTQKDLPSFWEGEINCKIIWKGNGFETDMAAMNIDANVSMDRPLMQSQELQTERSSGKTDMLFLRIKKSSNIKVD